MSLSRLEWALTHNVQPEIAAFDLVRAYALFVSEDEPPRNDPVSIEAWHERLKAIADALLSAN